MATIPPLKIEDRIFDALNTKAETLGISRSELLRTIITDAVTEEDTPMFFLVALPYETICSQTQKSIPAMTAVWRSPSGEIRRFETISREETR